MQIGFFFCCMNYYGEVWDRRSHSPKLFPQEITPGYKCRRNPILKLFATFHACEIVYRYVKSRCCEINCERCLMLRKLPIRIRFDTRFPIQYKLYNIHVQHTSCALVIARAQAAHAIRKMYKMYMTVCSRRCIVKQAPFIKCTQSILNNHQHFNTAQNWRSVQNWR